MSDPVRVVPQLAPGQMIIAEQVRTVFAVTIGAGVLLEDLLVPSFWSHHAAQLQPYNKVEVHPEDGTWYAEYLVTDCSRTWAKVKQLSFVQLTTPDVALTQASALEFKAALAGYKVVHRGPHKWSVVRNHDSAVMQEGIQVKEDAEAWLRTHVRGETGVAVTT